MYIWSCFLVKCFSLFIVFCGFTPLSLSICSHSYPYSIALLLVHFIILFLPILFVFQTRRIESIYNSTMNRCCQRRFSRQSPMENRMVWFVCLSEKIQWENEKMFRKENHLYSSKFGDWLQVFPLLLFISKEIITLAFQIRNIECTWDWPRSVLRLYCFL